VLPPPIQRYTQFFKRAYKNKYNSPLCLPWPATEVTAKQKTVIVTGKANMLVVLHHLIVSELLGYHISYVEVSVT
jgi:hypothetical protein